MEESIKEKISEYKAAIKQATEKIKIMNKLIANLQEKCPHKSSEHFKQEYVGRWVNCKDCGKWIFECEGCFTHVITPEEFKQLVKETKERLKIEGKI